jgi:hypothetical protein
MQWSPQKNGQYHGIQKGCGMVGDEDGGFSFLQLVQSHHIYSPEEDVESNPHQHPGKPVKHAPS